MKILKIQECRSFIAEKPNEDGSYHLTFSSEYAGQRAFGKEIIKHDPGSINMDYARNGVPLLWDHDPDKVIGRAENVRINPTTKQGEADARFFKDDPMADKVRNWVDQGHRETSFRYSVDDYTVVRSADRKTEPVVNITKSTIKEISIVGIPFDPSVGISTRSFDSEETIEIDVDSVRSDEPVAAVTVETTEPVIEAKTEVLEVIKEETRAVDTAGIPNIVIEVSPMTPEERKALNQLHNFATKQNCLREYEELSGSDKSVDEIRAALMDAIGERNQPITTTVPVEDAKELKKSFSLSRALEAKISGDWSKAGFEKDVQRQWESRQVNYNGGLIVPHEALRAADPNVMAISGQGANYQFTEFGGLYEMLRPQSVLLSHGAKVFNGLTNNYKFLQENAYPSTYWVSENPGQDVATSYDGTTTKTLSPHSLMAKMIFSRQQLVQTPGTTPFDVLATSWMTRELAIASDIAGFGNYSTAGVLTALSGAPSQGILLDPGVQTVAGGLGVNGGSISVDAAAVLNLKTLLNKANALNGFNPIYMTTPDIQGVLEKTVYPGLTYATVPYWYQDKLGGYSAIGTNNLPNSLTKGSAVGTCNAVIMGDPSNVAYGIFGDLILTVDPYTLAGQAQYRLIANQLMDVALLRPSAFAVITDAIAS
jgi:phage head maturation protease